MCWRDFVALLWLGRNFRSFSAQVVQNGVTYLYLFLSGGNSEMKIPSKSPLMALECTIMTQESNNWGKETLFVPFAPIYNDFANSIFVPIQRQSLIKRYDKKSHIFSQKSGVDLYADSTYTPRNTVCTFHSDGYDKIKTKKVRKKGEKSRTKGTK